MFKYIILFLPIILLRNLSLSASSSSLSSSSSSPSSSGTVSLKRPANQNKFVSVNAACSRKALLAIVVLRDPFYGILYARGYPAECSVYGNGSREIKLSFTVDQCGTKVIEKPDGSLEFDVYMYLQYERHVQQATDEVIQVQCIPQDVVVSSRVVPAKTPGQGEISLSTTRRTTTSTAAPHHLLFDSWMDILRGKMPTAVPITDYVNVGEEVTMLIKIRNVDGVEAKVIECIASDGLQENEQLLIDSNGCSVDSSIMPNLQERFNLRTGIKMVYSTFKVFRFPDRDNLHLQCKVLVCNVTCPLESCPKPKWSARSRARSTRASSNFQKIVEELDVFNSVEVKTPRTDSGSSRRSVTTAASYKEAPTKEVTAAPPPLPGKADNLFCLNSTRMVAIIGVLLGVLLISLVVTICMCVRARELRRRLVQRQSFPYGRVHEYS